MVLHHFTGRQDAVLAVSRAVRMHCSTTRTPAHPHTRTPAHPHTATLKPAHAVFVAQANLVGTLTPNLTLTLTLTPYSNLNPKRTARDPRRHRLLPLH